MSRRYGHRGWADRRRPRVLDVAPGLVHESGPVLGREWAPDRVAVMAHWSTSAEPSRSVVTMLRELDAGGFETVLVSAAEVPGPIGRVCTWAPGELALPEGTTVLRRANVGYDFGSWATTLAAFPGVAAASRVLLVNDSLIGPFAPLGPLLDDFESCAAPVWGLSGSLQHRPHVQSFFVGYKDEILRHPAMREFWSDIRVEARKAKIVRFNELGLSEVLDEAEIGWQTMFSPEPGGPPNPTINDWRRALLAGFPFLKAEVVSVPRGSVVADWSDIQPTTRAQFDQSLEDWLPSMPDESPARRSPARERIPQRAGIILDIDGPAGLIRACRHYVRGRA